MLLAAVVDWGALLKVVVASLVLGTGITLVFSLTILGATRSAEHRRQNEPLAATAYAVLMALALTATAAAVVFGLIVMTSK